MDSRLRGMTGLFLDVVRTLVDRYAEFTMLMNQVVGGGFSLRRDVRCGTTASRAKAPSHSPAYQVTKDLT